MDFPYLGSIVYALLKKPPAQLKNYIWDEEKHIWGILKRLKHNFGLWWALIFIYLQRVENRLQVVGSRSANVSWQGIRMDFPVLRTIVYSLFKNPSAYSENYIGPEEKYIWGSLKRLKHNFDPLMGAVKEIVGAVQNQALAERCQASPGPLLSGG